MAIDAVGRCSLLVLLALAAVVCCRHKPPDVEPDRQGTGVTRMELLPPDLPEPKIREKHEHRAPQAAPTTLEQDLPLYPQAAIEDAVACTAELLYHMETDGTATLVRLEWAVPPPEAHTAAFESKIREAVDTWRFVPAKRYKRKTQPDGSIKYTEQVIPEAARAVIRFRVEHGKAVVE